MNSRKNPYHLDFYSEFPLPLLRIPPLFCNILAAEGGRKFCSVFGQISKANRPKFGILSLFTQNSPLVSQHPTTRGEFWVEIQVMINMVVRTTYFIMYSFRRSHVNRTVHHQCQPGWPVWWARCIIVRIST